MILLRSSVYKSGAATNLLEPHLQEAQKLQEWFDGPSLYHPVFNVLLTLAPGCPREGDHRTFFERNVHLEAGSPLNCTGECVVEAMHKHKDLLALDIACPIPLIDTLGQAGA